MFSDLSNEQNLVILLSRLTFFEENLIEIEKIIKENLNWYDIFNMSTKNKVLNLIYYNLKRFNYDKFISPNLERILIFNYLGTQNRNTILLKELNNIMNVMKINKVPCIPLKGANLIPNIYKDLGIRNMNDLDFMINKENADTISQILFSLGYDQGEYDSEVNIIKPVSREKKILWAMNMNNLLPFIKKVDDKFVSFIELDFCFSLDLNLDINPVSTMLQRAQEYKELETCDFLFSYVAIYIKKQQIVCGLLLKKI
ncbi:hypothetical protein CIW83_05465 [Tissierella sp. P1]|uniref:nucleotidyltransferase family protein n=1 Tax=Tissierella sp. P1 TaxID=1280483 RepID=UPI000BA140C3|nr:nucleotidyltransferase family protein [Tissierella sp. P1]OZV12995.1 hypothetical protein CIW83_05465 [Tissierella sp. P1]